MLRQRLDQMPVLLPGPLIHHAVVPAIKIAGHCTSCNPMFTIDQQQAIQDLHYHETGRREHLFD